MPTFEVFWSDSARESNPGLSTTRRMLLTTELRFWYLIWCRGDWHWYL